MQSPPEKNLRISERPAEPTLPVEAPLVPVDGVLQRGMYTAKRWLRRYGHRLWWLHSLYALGLGIFVVSFAQKGFEHARWLAFSLGGAWLLVVLFFRLFGSGARQTNLEVAAFKSKIRFYAMTYALKNLYQGMLFFLLPFYYKSSTLSSAQSVFVAVLAMCAMLSTLDIVFDRVLMRWKTVAGLFHGFILFACLNLVIPALFPNTRTLYSLLAAALVTVIGFWTLHIDVRSLKKKLNIALMALSLIGIPSLAYAARMGIPAVPMYLSGAAVGPSVLGDGRLTMEVTVLHASVLQQLLAVTDIVIPGGKGDRLHHVWRLNNKEVSRRTEDSTRLVSAGGTIRLQSSLRQKDLPEKRSGLWSVDVETEDGQLVGRTTFRVID